MSPGGRQWRERGRVTKVRPALSFELALWTVAGKIGWPRVVEITGKADSTVRNWSDPDTSAAISLDDALKLDVAYRAAGGEGAPFGECYNLRLDADTAEATADSQALCRAAGELARKNGEAIEAAIAAAVPGASDKVIARAELEAEEAGHAVTRMLATLRARRNGQDQSAEAA